MAVETGSPRVDIRETGSEFRWPKVGERRSAEAGGGETDGARAKEEGSGMLGKGETRQAVGTPEKLTLWRKSCGDGLAVVEE